MPSLSRFSRSKSRSRSRSRSKSDDELAEYYERMKTDYQGERDDELKTIELIGLEIGKIKQWLRTFNKKNHKHRLSFKNFLKNYQILYHSRKQYLSLRNFEYEYKHKHNLFMKGLKASQINQDKFREYLIDEHNKDNYNAYENYY